MKKKTVFKCSDCGHTHPKWQGKCDSCDSWNSLEEVTIDAKKSTNKTSSNTGQAFVKPKKLNEVETSKSDRIITGISEFNRVMGGGIVRDSITILTAKPGAGKSTLLLQVA
ncbi:MAG: DNA repair protein RadA, partial [Anaerobacillus sp.]